jgi:hypothetical protein
MLKNIKSTCYYKKKHKISMAHCPAQKFYEGNLVNPERKKDF